MKEEILEILKKIKAEDVIIYNMRGFSPFYDEMILSSVSSQRQASAVVSYFKEAQSQNKISLRSVEGVGSSWIILDCNDIVVSVFTKEERAHFALENIYMDLPCETISL